MNLPGLMNTRDLLRNAGSARLLLIRITGHRHPGSAITVFTRSSSSFSSSWSRSRTLRGLVSF